MDLKKTLRFEDDLQVKGSLLKGKDRVLQTCHSGTGVTRDDREKRVADLKMRNENSQPKESGCPERRTVEIATQTERVSQKKQNPPGDE